MSNRRTRLPSLDRDAEFTITDELGGVDDRLRQLERKSGRAGIVRADTAAKAGEFLNIEAPSAGLTVILPEPVPSLRDSRITLCFRNTNPVRIVSIRGLVNRVAFVKNVLVGTFECICDGIDGWSAETGLSATGSTLAAIPDQRVLGNDSGVDAQPTPITVHQELDWIGGTSRWIFDGIDDRASIANVLSFERTDPFSVSGWFSSGTLTAAAAGRMISKCDTTANQRGWFVAAAGVSGAQQVQFGLINIVATNNIRIQTTATYTNDTLHHFVVTYDGSALASGVRIYIDGVNQALTTVNNNLTATTLSTAILTLGNREDGARPFQGFLEHLAVWNTTLTAADALEIYNAGTPPDLSGVAAHSSLVGWWKLDDTDAVGAGLIVDHGSGLNNATAQSGLAPTGPTGSLPVRGPTLWQIIPPGTLGLPLLSTGPSSVPMYDRLGFAGIGDLSGLSVLGRSANTSGVMAAITAATARHTLTLNQAGTALAWGFPIRTQVNTGVLTDGYTINAIDGTHTTAAFTPGAAGLATLQYNINLATLVAAEASVSIVVVGTTLVRAAITGAVAVAQNSNTSLFAGIRFNNAATTDRTNLNYLSTTRVAATLADDAGNDEIEISYDLVLSTITPDYLADYGEFEETGAGPFDDYSRTANVNGSFMFSNASAVTLRGLVSASWARGVPAWIQKQGAVGSLTVNDNAGTSAATSRFANFKDKNVVLQDDEILGVVGADITAGVTNDRRWVNFTHRYPFCRTDDMVAGDKLFFDGTNWSAAQGKVLIKTTVYTSGSGTHTFDTRTTMYELFLRGGGGGGGGANSAAAQSAVGGEGATGSETLGQCTTVPVSEAYSVGAQGTAGAATGTDGVTGGATTWSTAGVLSVAGGLGGTGSATATLGSGSNTTAGRFSMGGPAPGTSLTGTLPTGWTTLDAKLGISGQPGMTLSATAGWGGGNNNSGASSRLGIGAFSQNNVDTAGIAGHLGRIVVREYA